MNIKIYYQDNNIIVCEKPRGVISQSSDKICMPTLLNEQLKTEIYTVHRLDIDTTGVMIYAKNKKSARNLSKQIETHSFEKQYLAKLENLPQNESDVLKSLLFFDRKKNKSYVVNRQRNGVKQAELSYKVIDTENKIVSVKLKTGRTHQIRVQFANIGCPVLGDKRYGSHSDTFIHLHCQKIEFNNIDGKKIFFESMPEWI